MTGCWVHWFEFCASGGKPFRNDITVLDVLTYAGDIENIAGLLGGQIEFGHGNICDDDQLSKIVFSHDRRYVIDLIRLRTELGWMSKHMDFVSGSKQTI